jgi:jumonji domain-containing protein 2
LHDGATKTWYVIPPAFGKHFEDLVAKFYSIHAERCEALIRHKCIFLDLQLLERHGIPTVKVNQEKNDFIILFPYAYHMGFNNGYNIADAINFANI